MEELVQALGAELRVVRGERPEGSTGRATGAVTVLRFATVHGVSFTAVSLSLELLAGDIEVATRHFAAPNASAARWRHGPLGRRYRLSMAIVLITGLPGSGKSTLAGPLATALGLPIIAKDRLKEILFEALGVHDIAWSRQIGQAAITLQYEMMRTTKSAVVDSALWTDRSEAELEALKLPMVQVYCECPFEVARDRFFRRHKDGTRHEGFRDDSMTVEDFEAFRPLTEPLRLSCPLLRVGTAEPVDAAAVASAVQALL